MPLLRELALGPYFADVHDPRVERTNDHAVLDIISIAICAVICGADSWVEVEEFGTSKHAWLATILALPNGIPSHDTFTRKGTRRLCPDRSCPVPTPLWGLGAGAQPVRAVVIALDGKTHRRTHAHTNGKAALHLVSAWAVTNRLVLGQVAVDAKSNAIPAIPQLRDLRDLQACTVTIDVLGCQTTIAEHIVQRGGHDVLALNGNRPTMLAEMQALCADARAAQQSADGMTNATTMGKDHGRIETRHAFVMSDPVALQYLNERQHWAQLRSVALIEAERNGGATVTREQRDDLLRQELDAAMVNQVVRGHWGIENRVHWVLDVTFHEDASRIRIGHAPQNIGVLRHIALNLLRQELSTGSRKTTRFRAALNDEYLAHVLGV